jgi:hypothetical protein
VRSADLLGRGGKQAGQLQAARWPASRDACGGRGRGRPAGPGWMLGGFRPT